MFSKTMKSAALAVAAVAVLGSAGVSAALAQSNDGRDRRVRIINQTGMTMTHFYASNISRDTWEEDILGTSVLPNGRAVTINIDDGTGACRYDFKARFQDGQELERRDINVCQITDYTYTR